MKERKEKPFKPIKNDTLEKVFVSLTLDTRHISSEMIPFCVRIHFEGRKFYYLTGFRCTLEEYYEIYNSTGKGASAKSEVHKRKLGQIKIYNKAMGIIKTLNDAHSFSIEKFKEEMNREESVSFSELWQQVINETKNHNTSESYKYAYNSFHKFARSKGNISFKDISDVLINEWREDMTKNEIKSSTQGFYLRAMRVVVNEAIKIGYVKKEQYPFTKDRIKIQKGATRKYNYIDIETINKINAFQSDDMAMMQSKDMFIFSYLAGGANLADIALLKWDQYYYNSGESELKFIRKKTLGKSDADVDILIPITDDVRMILNKWGSVPSIGDYVFPFILNGAISERDIAKRISQENQNIRKRLHRICKALGLPQNLSPTWARHSFKTNAEHLRIPTNYIEMAMGHTLGGVKDNYMGLFPKEDRIKYTRMLLNPMAGKSKEDLLADIQLMQEMLSKM